MTPISITAPPKVTPKATCSCEAPVPIQRAERKGASLTVCLRCGGQVPARLR